MFDLLTDKLQGVFRRLGSRGSITEKDLDEALREVRLALLEADVNVRVVRRFVEGVRAKALGAEVLKSLTPAQQVIGTVQRELVELLGGSESRLNLAPRPPSVVLLVGLKGSGKTTTAAKLALHVRKGGTTPLLASVDRVRVAGAEQLATLGRQLGVATVVDGGRAPVALAERALAEARRQRAGLLIVDTPGYLRLDGAAREELAAVKAALQPSEVLLVADAMTGQEAVNVAQEFQAALELTGLVLTKLDGDARGGGALSIRAVTGLPVKFVGTGERVEALEAFHPDRFASRILGMGDIVSLVERAQATIDREGAQAVERRLKAGAFDLQDFLDQLQQVRRMGPLGQLLQLVPGASALRGRLGPEGLEEGQVKRLEAIIQSMTPRERRHPEIIDGSRRRRIAGGSGTTPHEVNQLLQQFTQTRQLMQQLSSGRLPSGMLGAPALRGGPRLARVGKAPARLRKRRRR